MSNNQQTYNQIRQEQRQRMVEVYSQHEAAIVAQFDQATYDDFVSQSLSPQQDVKVSLFIASLSQNDD